MHPKFRVKNVPRLSSSQSKLKLLTCRDTRFRLSCFELPEFGNEAEHVDSIFVHYLVQYKSYLDINLNSSVKYPCSQRCTLPVSLSPVYSGLCTGPGQIRDA
jgi:hypothetical protein